MDNLDTERGNNMSENKVPTKDEEVHPRNLLSLCKNIS